MLGESSKSRKIAPSIEFVLESRVASKVVMYNFVMMQLGERQITDGATRPIYRSDDGRQNVLADNGEPVYETWLHPYEYSEPVVLSNMGIA
jgi:hypothetical protein